MFGADLIAGFPTETDAMFENSRRIVDDCGLTYLHVFPFSARRGTPAARMPQVAGNVIKERAARLREKGTIVLSSYLSAQRGRVVDVLVESGGKGRTPQFAEVRAATANARETQVPSFGRASVRADSQRLVGEACA